MAWADESERAPRARAASARTTVLVVDDEAGFQETIAQYLGGYRRLTAYNGHQALEKLARHHVDVVLLDLNLPDTTGLKLTQQIRAERDQVEIIILTSHFQVPEAVACIKAGAFDFLAKSYESYQVIGEHVERALENRRRRRRDVLAGAPEHLRAAIELAERSKVPAFSEMLRLLRQVAPTPLTVLTEGESGVGKELVARYLHMHSDRADRPFVAVNMAAIPPTLLESTLFGHERGSFTGAERAHSGKFELADGGTLFLDEVGELDPAAQAKLLRALQEHQVERVGAIEPSPVDVRVIAATNKDLEREVVEGRFREDLWFRLNVVRVRVPPLRQRQADVPALVELLTRRHADAMNRPRPHYRPETIAALQAYAWPGNVRELENFIMRTVALHPGGTVRVSDLPLECCIDHFGRLATRFAERDRAADESQIYTMAREHFERQIVRLFVARCGGNKAEAARQLGVSYATVKSKMVPTDDTEE